MKAIKFQDPALTSKTSLQFAKIVQPFSGAFISGWKDHRGLYNYYYGTGTLVSPRMVLTCCHMLYSQTKQTRCDIAIFIPGALGRLSENKCYNIQQYGFRYQPPVGSFRDKPTAAELALVVLKEPVEGSENMDFPSIGTITGEAKDTPLFMVAYPSQFTNLKQKWQNSCVVYKKREGKVHSIQDRVINHTITTTPGSSGGAIFAQTPQARYFICGIHTHGGLEKNINRGLYFTPQILNRLQQYSYQMINEFKLKEQPKILQYCTKNAEKEVQTEQQDDENNSNCSQMSLPGYFQQDSQHQSDNSQIMLDLST